MVGFVKEAASSAECWDLKVVWSGAETQQKLNLVHFVTANDCYWLTDWFDSTVLTWIQQTASVRILMIAQKFFKAWISGELMPQPSIVIGSGTDVGWPVVWSWSHRLNKRSSLSILIVFKSLFKISLFLAFPTNSTFELVLWSYDLWKQIN